MRSAHALCNARSIAELRTKRRRTVTLFWPLQLCGVTLDGSVSSTQEQFSGFGSRKYTGLNMPLLWIRSCTCRARLSVCAWGQRKAEASGLPGIQRRASLFNIVYVCYACIYLYTIAYVLYVCICIYYMNTYICVAIQSPVSLVMCSAVTGSRRYAA